MRNPWLPSLLTVILALTFLVYLPALDAGFVFDDQPNIVFARGVHWNDLSVDSFKGLFEAPLRTRRVVANLTFGLNHLVGGLNPRGYHLANVLLHLLAGVALAWLSAVYLGRWSRAGPHDGKFILGVGVPVGLFLLHPLNTQAVTYVVQRMSVLAGLFCLLALAAYLVGRGEETRRGTIRWMMLAGLLWFLGLGSKENALALPLVVLTYEWCFHRAEWRRWASTLSTRARRNLIAAGVIGSVSMVGILAVYVGDTAVSFTHRWSERDFNGLERVLTQPRAHLFYAALLVWPSPGRLNLDHDFAVSRGLLDPPSTGIALALWIVAAIGVIVLAGRRPLVGFPLLAYLELHLIESGPINLELVFEHRMYFPMAMLALAAGALTTELRPAVWRPAMAMAVTIGGALAVTTYVRNGVWVDPIEFHYDVARKSPNKFRPQYNLGTVLGQAGRVGDAVAPLERAASLRPENSEVHNQLGNAYLLSGRVESAATEYRRAVELGPRNLQAMYNLALALERMGHPDEALPYYERFIQMAPPALLPQVQNARRRMLGIERTENR